jgi:predicted nucleotidyltransferase
MDGGRPAGYLDRVSNAADVLSKELPEKLGQHPEIAVAYLFGSQARGDAWAESDVDIGLVYRTRQTPRAVHERVADAVARDVGAVTGIERVDVVDLEAQGPLFCHRVLCEGRRLFVADEARRIDFESDAIVRGIDFRPTYEIATRGKIQALRRWLRESHDVGASPTEAGRPEGQSR